VEPVAADVQKQAKRRNLSPKNKPKQFSDQLLKEGEISRRCTQ
jgi:hypothetical protein